MSDDDASLAAQIKAAVDPALFAAMDEPWIVPDDVIIDAVIPVIRKAQAAAWLEGTEAVEFSMEKRGFLSIPDGNPYAPETEANP